MTLQEIKTAITNGEYADNGIEALTQYLREHPEDDEALTLRGMRHWGRGDRASAINDYLAAIRINPDSRARLAIRATHELLDYFNPDLYNP